VRAGEQTERGERTGEGERMGEREWEREKREGERDVRERGGGWELFPGARAAFRARARFWGFGPLVGRLV
jgi:hypothetical protein